MRSIEHIIKQSEIHEMQKALLNIELQSLSHHEEQKNEKNLEFQNQPPQST